MDERVAIVSHHRAAFDLSREHAFDVEFPPLLLGIKHHARAEGVEEEFAVEFGVE